MRLFLLRHAAPKDTFPDEERELSDFGLTQISTLSKSLSKSVFDNVAQVWHSPFIRARQTAELFAKEMEINAPLLSSATLTPMSNPNDVANQISSLCCFCADLLIVAHNPLLESVAQMILGKNSASYIHFKTCTLASFNLEQLPMPDNKMGVWELEFLLSPAVLAK